MNAITPQAPEVSVVIGVRNGVATLQRCLDSIAAQDFASRETLVVDGASTDGTRELVERNARAGKVGWWISEPDGGIYQAWNKAIRRSRGRWIAFLGCDDVFHDAGSLGALVAAGKAAGERARVVHGRINRVTAQGVLVETIGTPWDQAREPFLRGVNIPHPGTLHLRAMLEARGLFDESYRIAGDYNLLLSELPEHAPVFVDRVVVDMGFGGMSSRPRNILVSLREVARARRAHGLSGTPAQLRAALAFAWLGAAIYRLLGARAYGRLADFYRALRGRPKIWTA
jgi:glycosyltransferase involved in cell wall biosynthesis